MEHDLLAQTELRLEELRVLRQRVDLGMNRGNGKNEVGFDLGVEEVAEIVAPAIEEGFDAERIDDLRVSRAEKSHRARLFGVDVLRVDHLLLRFRRSIDEAAAKTRYG